MIEILVVILIIGILAAIALPNFVGQRDNAQDSGAKSLARNAVTELQGFASETDSFDATDAELLELAPELADAQAWDLDASENAYMLSVTSTAGHVFTVGRTAPDAPLVRECTVAGQGGCSPSGTW